MRSPPILPPPQNLERALYMLTALHIKVIVQLKTVKSTGCPKKKMPDV